MIHWANLLAIALLLPVAAFCSAAEIGTLAVGRLRARQLADEGSRAAQVLLHLLVRPSRLLATILVAITSLLYTIEALSTKTTLDANLGLWVPLLLVPPLVIVLVEVTPILYASQNPERVALTAARFVGGLQVALYPVVGLFTGIVNLLLRPFGMLPLAEHSVTEEEIKLAIEVAEEEGAIEEDASDLLTGVMEFHDKRAREILVPRVDMVCVEESTPLSQVLKTAVESHHSRLPVYAETVDNIVGVVHTKDLIPYLGTPAAETTAVREVTRETCFVPETRRVDALLQELQRSRRTLAIVYGEHGGTTGLVTVEDVLEEVVGEIVDEHDEEESDYEQVADDVWLLDPRLTLRQIERLTDVDLLRQLPTEEAPHLHGLTEADTLSELILTLIEDRPAEGHRFRLGHVEITVEKMVGLRIEQVRLQTDLPRHSGLSLSAGTEGD